MKHIIDITLTTEQEAAITDAVAALPTAMPFLHSFSADQRKRLVRMGPRRESFARLALEVAQQHGAYIPSTVEVAKLQRDIGLIDTLTPVKIQLQNLLQQVKDTQAAAAHDACEAGLEVYRALRGHAREAGLDPTVTQLGRALLTRPVPTEPPAGEGPNP
ncbi:MAG: hypothetical protein ACO1QR_10950 [Chthoniobacteraceae bacterium]